MSGQMGLVMEGGAMRGMFTCGVIDVLLENGIEFDGAIGVSAGAVFGCNYKSKQIGRAIRYNKKYCNDYRFGSVKSFLKTGNLFDSKFCYETLPNELDVFDVKTYQNNSMDFYVTCTDIEKGEAVYHNCMKGDAGDITWMRASASIPMVSEIVEIDGYKLLDGGMADSVPLSFFESIGYSRNLVILTQPKSYRKKKASYIAMARLVLKKYPKLIELMKNRHTVYNSSVEYVHKREKEGDVFVIQPSEPLNIKAAESNPNELERVYQMGRSEANKQIDKLKAFMFD